MDLAFDLTPTQKQARDRRRAFHATIEARACRLAVPAPEPVPEPPQAIIEAPKPEPVIIWQAAPEREPIGQVAKIQAAVCKYYGNLSIRDMRSEDRTRPVARPRQVAIWLARKLSNHSTTQIGHFFGDRDHATILHGVKVISRLMLEDEQMAFDVAYLLIEITGEAQ